MSKETHTSKGAIITSSAAIVRAAKIFGSEAALASAIGVTRQTLNYWKGALLNYDRAVAIHVVTNGKVDIDDLRPDMKPLTKKLKTIFLNSFSLDATSKKLLVDIRKIKVSHFREELGDIKGLMESIKKNGLVDPIEINQDMTLARGERRLEALKKLKKRFVPAIMCDYLPPAARRFLDNFYHKPHTEREKARIEKKLKQELKRDQKLEALFAGLLTT